MNRQFELVRKIIFQFGFSLFFICISFVGFAQQKNDSLLQAVELNKTTTYKQAYELLAKYRQSHKADVNAEWLFGQAAFYIGKTKEMMLVYEANIKANNENYYLKLDYAFRLVDAGQLEKAQQLLKLYLPYDSTNAQIYASLAKIDFWKSNYKSAFKNITKALQILPENQQYNAQREEIKLAMSPWISVNVDYNKDNQPLKTITPAIEGGMYFNAKLLLHASIQSQLIDTNGKYINAQFFSLGNKSVFAKQGLTVRVNAGAIVYPNNATKATGLIGIDKTFFKSLTVTAQAERKPYLSMLGSLDTSIATTNITASAKWEHGRGFMGQVAYSASLFDDKNVITTKSAWFVSPELKAWKFGFRAGYGYSFTTSKNDMFVPVTTKNQLFYDIYFNPNVVGQFKPYLTPKDQEVNSLIGVVTFSPSSLLKLTVSGSYGFKASIKTPYLFGYYDAQSQVIVAKDFYTEKYTTLDLNARADLKVSKTVSAKIEYHHNRPNYYYTNDYVGVGLKMILCNVKK
jgi:tetratricopeptide (TPR) repeat protein